MLRIATAVCLGLLGAGTSAADEADAFFRTDLVHEIRIYFDNPDWYQEREWAHSGNPEDPYFPARFVYGDLVLDPIGARFKGNSSFRQGGVKKGLKFDFNEYQEGTEEPDFTFYGLTKLTLNNGWSDPTQLRETLFLEFARRYLPGIRTTFIRLYVNDEYFGLFSTVEQLDAAFIRSRFGEDEDGNMFEGEISDGQGGGVLNGSALVYLGPDPEDYYANYQLKTNRTANDWSNLVEFIDVLNNTPAEELPRKLEPIADVENILLGMAANILFINLDSYCGGAHNYYMFDRDATGQFIHLHWDMNMAFGTFRRGIPPGENPLTLDPLWLPVPGGGGPGGGGSWERPLMENLWAVEKYRRFHLRALARMLREGFDETTMGARIQELAGVIRNDVYADPNYIYTPAQFEQGLTESVDGSKPRAFGLLEVVRERVNYLRPVLDAYAEPSDVRLNELMTVNTSTLADGADDYDPWVELHNLGPGQVELAGFYLTDNAGDQTKWALPAGTLADGEFLVLWIDGEAGEGNNHASFSLQPGGGSLYLYHDDGGRPQLVDTATYPGLGANESFARSGGIDSQWAVAD